MDNLKIQLHEIEKEQENPEVWQDLKKSTELAQKAKSIRNKLSSFDKAYKTLEDASDLIELAALEDVRTQRDADCLQAKRKALTRAYMGWHFDLRFPSI